MFRSWSGRSRRGRSLPLSALVVVLLLSGVVSAAARTPVHQPDGKIKFASDRYFLGNNIYNTNGAGQTRSYSALAGATATFFLKFQNDGRTPDQIGVRGCGSVSGYRVHYFHHGRDVTAAVRSGIYRTDRLTPGTEEGLTLKIQTESAFGSSYSCGVTATSVKAPTRQDVVVAVVYTQA